MNKPKKQGHRKGKTVGSQMHHSTRSLGKLSTWGRMQGNNNLSKGIVMAYSEIPTMTEKKLKGIATLSAAKPKMKFTQLMHHFNEESLQTCYKELDGKKAIGSDGVDKEEYGKNLNENLKLLVKCLKKMAYIPGEIRQVLISKDGKPGETRPLGISNFEDKIVQKMTQKVLESIYEPLFYDISYGFRPKRSCHDAVKVLQNHLSKHEIETVIDADLANFFGSIDRELLLENLGKKIGDQKLIRYLRRMFKAGILVDGDLIFSEDGVVQGSICSPILSNIFAHEVIDIWIEEMVKPLCKGSVKMTRYADDLVICCGRNEDAERIKKALAKRLAKYNLKMNEEKTKLINFSRRKHSLGEKQETFDFLGFTFYLGKSRRGKAVIKVKTKGKAFRSKLKKANEWARDIRNRYTLNSIMKQAAAKLRGHIQYYGVSHNYATVNKFVLLIKRILFKWLNRRSHRKSFTWEQFQKYLDRVKFPEPKICHALF